MMALIKHSLPKFTKFCSSVKLIGLIFFTENTQMLMSFDMVCAKELASRVNRSGVGRHVSFHPA
jgi:hypothetical protein